VLKISCKFNIKRIVNPAQRKVKPLEYVKDFTKMRQTMTLFLISLISICTVSQDYKDLPEDFSNNALIHIEKLCDFGIRKHNLPSGSSTINYLKEQFENNGLHVQIDTFNFGWVKLNNRKLKIDRDSIIVQSVFINQMLKPDIIIKAECKFIDGNISIEQNVNEKIIFTSISNNTLLLKEHFPAAVVVLRIEDFKKLNYKDNQVIELVIQGDSIEQLEESYNVICTYKSYNESKKDILITGHWDSQGGPGADDNASGLSLLLELSKYFKEYQELIPYNLKFIALGSEEMGLLGSKAYAFKYTDQIVDNCLLNLNIDAVAGGKKPYIEMRNPVNFKNPDNGEWMEIITYPDSKDLWYTSFLEVYRNSSSEKIYPDWLTEDIKSAMNKARIKYYKASCCSGADHRSFAYLDLPIVYLGMTRKYEKNIHHTENDNPKDYFRNSLEITGKTAQSILIEICADKN